MTGRRGFSLIEVVIVVAIIAMSLGLAGPRIGAGLGRLELDNSAKTVRGFIKLARIQAQRTDRQQYIVLNKSRGSIALVSDDLKLVREEALPSSVQLLFEGDSPTTALYVMPSGVLRGAPIRLHGRTGEVEVSLQ
jgi:prepilin-type N-terminal cleavage/methylation domain-containing protein